MVAQYTVGDHARKGMELFGLTDDHVRRALAFEVKQSMFDTLGWAHTVAILEEGNERFILHAVGEPEQADPIQMKVLAFVPLPARIRVQDPVAMTLRALLDGGYGIYLRIGEGDDATGNLISDVVVPGPPVPDEWQSGRGPGVPPLGGCIMQAEPDGQVRIVIMYMIDLEAIQRDCAEGEP